MLDNRNIPAEMSREEWLERRRKGIGSTDAAAILGRSPWKTALHVYLDKIGELQDEDSEEKRMGRKLEALIADEFQERTPDVRVAMPRQQLYVHPSLPQLITSLDRELFWQSGNEGILECKSSRDGGGWRQQGTDDLPVYYLIQCQHQMVVCNAEKVNLAVLIGGNEFRTYEVHYNWRFCEKMVPILLDFWKRVENKTPPPLDWEHPGTIELVQKMYGVDDTKTVQLEANAEMLLREYLICSAEIRANENMKERAKAELLALMAGASVAHLPDGSMISRKMVNRATYTAKATSYPTFSVKSSEALKSYVAGISQECTGKTV